MTVGIYAENINHFIETLAYFISLDEKCEVFLITDIGTSDNLSEHPWCLRRLKNHENIKIISKNETPRAFDRLYFHMCSGNSLRRSALSNWIKKSKNIGSLRESHYNGTWKKALKELIYSFPHCLLAKSILFQDSPLSPHPYIFVKNKCFYSPSVHPQFFSNKEWGRKLFSSGNQTDRERTFRLAFIGTKEPEEREALLKRIKKILEGSKNTFLRDTFPASEMRKDRFNILWIEYDSKSQRRGLNPAIYTEALKETDFYICPLGWGGNWTHRVVESLLCNAIPILEDEKRYNIGLKDMENCIIVKNGDWAEGIKKVRALESNDIKKMRVNIRNLREKYLLPKIAAARLRNAMGL